MDHDLMLEQKKRDFNAYAWGVIMQKLRELRGQGVTLEAIGDNVAVNRATVARWFSEEMKGERVTFGAMMVYAKQLDIPFEELIKPE